MRPCLRAAFGWLSETRGRLGVGCAATNVVKAAAARPAAGRAEHLTALAAALADVPLPPDHPEVWAVRQLMDTAVLPPLPVWPVPFLPQPAPFLPQPAPFLPQPAPFTPQPAPFTPPPAPLPSAQPLPAPLPSAPPLPAPAPPQTLSADAAPLLPPQLLGAFFKDYAVPWAELVLDGQVGRGATSDVFKAVYTHRELPVAVKIFRAHPSHRTRAELGQRVVGEACARALPRPFLAAFYGWVAGHPEGRLALVTEFFPAGTLAEYLRGPDGAPPGRAPLAPLELLRVLKCAGFALSRLHASGGQLPMRDHELHRDVKSANVGVVVPGAVSEGHSAKLLDTGFARWLFAAGGGVGGDGDGDGDDVLPATPGIAAPELAEAGCHSRSSDVFGFGVVLGEVVGGARFSPAEVAAMRADPAVRAQVALLRRASEEEAARWHGLPANARGRVARLAELCMAAAPGARPSSADVAEQLAQLCDEAEGLVAECPLCAENGRAGKGLHAVALGCGDPTHKICHACVLRQARREMGAENAAMVGCPLCAAQGRAAPVSETALSMVNAVAVLEGGVGDLRPLSPEDWGRLAAMKGAREAAAAAAREREAAAAREALEAAARTAAQAAERLGTPAAAAAAGAAAEALRAQAPADVLSGGQRAALGVKLCPGCGFGIIHARNHGCHHIKPAGAPGDRGGCPQCHTHFCFSCLHVYRGASHACPNGCTVFCRDSGDHVCDCVDCVECRAGAPCATCSGCRVCRAPPQ